MTKYGIIADSGCDLKQLTGVDPDKITFSRAPLVLRVGDREYEDVVDLDVKEFMDAVKAYEGPTGTAAPNPQTWYDAFCAADEVFAVTITSSLSGSYNSAVSALKMIQDEDPDKKVHIIDSKSAGAELTMIVEKLVELMEQELPFEEIVEKIEDYQINQAHLLFVLETLDNLVKNGRVSKLKGNMAGLLGIKILGCASEKGTLEVLKNCRGKLTVYKKLIQEMKERGYKGGKVLIGHCFNESKANYIRDGILKEFPDADVRLIETSGLCSYYAQEGGIMMGYESC